MVKHKLGKHLRVSIDYLREVN